MACEHVRDKHCHLNVIILWVVCSTVPFYKASLCVGNGFFNSFFVLSCFLTIVVISQHWEFMHSFVCENHDKAVKVSGLSSCSFLCSLLRQCFSCSIFEVFIDCILSTFACLRSQGESSSLFIKVVSFIVGVQKGFWGHVSIDTASMVSISVCACKLSVGSCLIAALQWMQSGSCLSKASISCDISLISGLGFRITHSSDLGHQECFKCLVLLRNGGRDWLCTQHLGSHSQIRSVSQNSSSPNPANWQNSTFLRNKWCCCDLKLSQLSCGKRLINALLSSGAVAFNPGWTPTWTPLVQSGHLPVHPFHYIPVSVVRNELSWLQRCSEWTLMAATLLLFSPFTWQGHMAWESATSITSALHIMWRCFNWSFSCSSPSQVCVPLATHCPLSHGMGACHGNQQCSSSKQFRLDPML